MRDAPPAPAPTPVPPVPGHWEADTRLRELLERLEAERERARRAPRRSLSPRVAGIALIVAALGLGAVVLATTSSAVRHQLALSFTRQPARYVELFVSSSSVRTPLGAGRAHVRMEVEVRTHEEDLARQPVTLEVRRGDAVTVRRRALSVPSGERALITLSAPLPRGRGPWVAEVTLPGRAERLRVHGGAGAGG